MEIDHKIFYAIIFALLLNECKIAGSVTSRVDFDQTRVFAPRSLRSLSPRVEKFSVSLAHPVFKDPLHETTSGLLDTRPALPVGPASWTSASFATAVPSVHVAKTLSAKSVALPSVRYVFGQTSLSKQCRPR